MNDLTDSKVPVNSKGQSAWRQWSSSLLRSDLWHACSWHLVRWWVGQFQQNSLEMHEIVSKQHVQSMHAKRSDLWKIKRWEIDSLLKSKPPNGGSLCESRWHLGPLDRIHVEGYLRSHRSTTWSHQIRTTERVALQCLLPESAKTRQTRNQGAWAWVSRFPKLKTDRNPTEASKKNRGGVAVLHTPCLTERTLSYTGGKACCTQVQMHVHPSSVREERRHQGRETNWQTMLQT